MFKKITHIDQIRPAVAGKKEVRFQSHPGGITLACYMFMDSHTFDSPEALECRGIAFGPDGSVVSRPLHKFFNVGEKEWLTADKIAERNDIVAVYEKLDGSMLATAWVDGQLKWRSKKSFSSDVVKLTEAFLAEAENQRLQVFASEVARQGMTAIFELTHPQARIVVAQDKPQLRLLHVRDNMTGEYVLLDKQHPIHALVEDFEVPCVKRFDMDVPQVMASLEAMQNMEGYVLQFANGDMVKLKCPWYNRFHHSITFLRERDIAVSALNEELDDLKAVLAEAGIDLGPINEVEARLKARLVGIMQDVETAVAGSAHLDRKGFALANKSHPLFGLMMAHYLGQEVDIKQWYAKSKLRDEFSLRVLADGALAEAMEG